jgi:hypothetical protein
MGCVMGVGTAGLDGCGGSGWACPVAGGGLAWSHVSSRMDLYTYLGYVF